MQSIAEFYNPMDGLQTLKNQLRRIRKFLQPHVKCGHLPNNKIPFQIREELCQIYDQHGGLRFLSDYTQIQYTSLRRWVMSYNLNPAQFRNRKILHRSKYDRNKEVMDILFQHPEEKPVKKKKIITESSTPFDIIFNEISEQAQSIVTKLRPEIEATLANSQSFGEKIIEDIRKLFMIVKKVLECSILLGIDKNMFTNCLS